MQFDSKIFCSVISSFSDYLKVSRSGTSYHILAVFALFLLSFISLMNYDFTGEIVKYFKETKDLAGPKSFLPERLEFYFLKIKSDYPGSDSRLLPQLLHSQNISPRTAYPQSAYLPLDGFLDICILPKLNQDGVNNVSIPKHHIKAGIKNIYTNKTNNNK